MKRLRRLSLSFRRSKRQTDGDSHVGSVHTGPRTACSDDEALPRRPRRRLTKKRHGRQPSLEADEHLRAPPSPSPSSSPSPPLARVPFPVQKRVPPPALPDEPSSSSTSSPPPEPPTLGILSPSTPPAPTPLSVIVEQDERSLRSAGFSLHSAASPPAAVGELERERRRTMSGLSSVKDASRPGSASDKARSIYERPSAPAPPSPPATPTRELDPQTSAAKETNPTNTANHAPYTPFPPSSYPPNLTHTDTNSSSTLIPHSPTDTDAYATAAESLLGDPDEPEEASTEGHERLTILHNHDNDTPSPTVRARVRPSMRVGNGAEAGLGEVYQYPPARHTFGLWEPAGTEEVEGSVDSPARDHSDDSDDNDDELREGSVRSSASASDGERDQNEDEPEDTSPARPWRTRHASSSTTSPAATFTPIAILPSPVIAIPNDVIQGLSAAPDTPPVSLPDVLTLPHTSESASLPLISESASLPHLSDSLPLPLPPSSPPLSSSDLEPQLQAQPQTPQSPRTPRIQRVPVPQDQEPPTPTPQTLQSPSPQPRPPRPRTLRPHPFLEGRAGEKLGGRGGGLWDVRVSGGEWGDETGRGGEGAEEGEREREEEQGNKEDGTEEDAGIPEQGSATSKIGDTPADDTTESQPLSTADNRAASQAHVESSIAPHPSSSPPTAPAPPHPPNRSLPTVPPHPPGLPLPRAAPLTSTVKPTTTTTTPTPTTPTTPTTPITFARRPSLVPTLALSASLPSSPPASPSSPPPLVTSFSAPAPTSASASRSSPSPTGVPGPAPSLTPSPLPLSSSSSPPPSSPPLSRSTSLTRLIASTFTRPARTVLKKPRRRSVTVSPDGAKDRGGGVHNSNNNNNSTSTRPGEAYTVEPWRNGIDNNNNVNNAGVGAGAGHAQQPPSRQQYYSWAGQEEFTASLVAEYGAMLSPFLATPGNSRPPTQAYDDRHGPNTAGNSNNTTANNNALGEGQSASGSQTLDTLRSGELERAALLGGKSPPPSSLPPSKRVGRKLSKRRKPASPSR